MSDGLMRQKVHCVIPARYESSRLPGKPLVDLCGKPMIVRSWERVCEDIPEEQITVATDDARIIQVCRSYGINAVLTSEECRTGTDRVAEVASRRPDVDVWVIAMGDNPLLPPGVVSSVVSRLTSTNAAAAMGRAVIKSQEERDDDTTQKMVITRDGRLVYISRCPIPWTRTGGVYYKAVNVFACRRDELRQYAAWKTADCEAREGLEILRFIEHGCDVTTVEVSSEGWSVDVPADVVRTREALRQGV